MARIEEIWGHFSAYCSSSRWAAKQHGDMERKGAQAGLSDIEGLENGPHPACSHSLQLPLWHRVSALKHWVQGEEERLVWRQQPGQRGDEYFICSGA